jgi:NADP-dependent 3-hydroxy acid dehydrogenase YdfG
MTTPPVAIITGATSGIGRAIALALGQRGHAVAICARTPGHVAAVVDELRGAGIRAWGAPCDVGVAEQVEAFCREAERQLGDVLVLVNNAGVGLLKPVAEMSVEEWDQVFATNIRSVFLMTRAVLPAMRQRRRGWIINIASLAGKNGLRHGAAYSATKHAMRGFAASLMLEVRQEGVRVATLFPGSVNTGFGSAPGRSDDERARMLQPEDVAEAVVGVLALPPRALISELDLRPAAPSW